MKINERTRFPHPVLSEDTGDYSTGSFTLEVTGVAESSMEQVTLDYTVELTEPGLLQRVSDGTASVGIFVTCLDTYYSRLITLGLTNGRFAFDPGVLVGRVEIRPLVWARAAIGDLSLANCSSEFGTGTVALDAGSVLAFGDLQVLNVGREKLAQMDTIFSIVEDATLEDDQLAVNLDDDRIQVRVASSIHQQVNVLRNKAVGKAIVLNSVFLPAVMQVLDILRGGGAEFEGKRWHRVFIAKCDFLGIDLQDSDLWADAQKLLRAPFSEIRNKNQLFGD